MYIQRDIDNHLEAWRLSLERKPLLLRGARQVGKSSAVRELGKKFRYYLEINFEEQRQVYPLFRGNLSPVQLAENLSALYNVPIVAGETLLFFDEIQQCPDAISSLRFFYEQWPELHVIAAGSLLEFALQELPSFGVGRIRSLFMYPFSFNEFLSALKENTLLKLKEKASPEKLLPEPIHLKLVDLLKRYFLIGGMPEVVVNYTNGRSLVECQQVLDDLIISLRADFVKYRKKVPSLRIHEVFGSVVEQAGSKFIFKNAADANHGQIKEAIELLIMAGLVIPVTHTSANGIPLGAEANFKKRKMLLFDIGIYQRLLGLPLSEILLENPTNLTNKGALAEIFAGLEIVKAISPFQIADLYYWHRESKSSNAEVDYVLQRGSQILPVEVKSGIKGSMQSMFSFLKEKNQPVGWRLSLEPFSTYDSVISIPLYSIAEALQKN